METEEWRIKIAKAAYSAFSTYIKGTAFKSDHLPAFENLPERIRKAWIAAGMAAIESVPKAIL